MERSIRKTTIQTMVELQLDSTPVSLKDYFVQTSFLELATLFASPECQEDLKIIKNRLLGLCPFQDMRTFSILYDDFARVQSQDNYDNLIGCIDEVSGKLL